LRGPVGCATRRQGRPAGRTRAAPGPISGHGPFGTRTTERTGGQGPLPAEIPFPADRCVNWQQAHRRTLNQDRRGRVLTCWAHHHRPSEDPPVPPTCAFAPDRVHRSQGRNHRQPTRHLGPPNTHTLAPSPATQAARRPAASRPISHGRESRAQSGNSGRPGGQARQTLCPRPAPPRHPAHGRPAPRPGQQTTTRFISTMSSPTNPPTHTGYPQPVVNSRDAHLRIQGVAQHLPDQPGERSWSPH
jgi:hypothetical protein